MIPYKSFLKIMFLVFFTVFINCKKETKNHKNVSRISKSWKPIFNGKNLEGWIPKINGYELGDNYKNTFQAENGILKVSYKNYDHFVDEFGHLFYKTAFTNYKLRLKYRFVGDQVKGGESWATKNSGIMIHCQPPESIKLKQAFPVSLEVQLLGGVNEEEARPSGNLCTPGTHVEMDGVKIIDHCIAANCKTFYGDEWITAEVWVLKNKISHYINGDLVISYNNPTIGGEFLETSSKEIQAKDGQALTSGYISLQSESHPIEFKEIAILEL